MNRSVAQTARVIGVDSAQVKTWAWMFKDLLSAQANPQKGKARSFSDSDVLALSYVCTRWEEKPDLESIRFGLQEEEHYQEYLCENLYLHTPILQEPPDDLDETWRHGILLCGAGGQEFIELARNYKHVAENLLETALESGEPLDFAYPVLFAYRHTLELYLKIIGEIKELTHSLAQCVELVEKHHGRKIGMPIRGWILELERMDPAGTAFRYADAESSAIMYEEHWLDLMHFKFAMGRVFELLDSATLHSSMTGKTARRFK